MRLRSSSRRNALSESERKMARYMHPDVAFYTNQVRGDPEKASSKNRSVKKKHRNE